MEKNKTKQMIFTVLTVILSVSIMPFFQSCNEDNLNVENVQKLEYLDLDVSKIKVLTTEQKQILKEAKSRIEPFVVLEGKTYRLTINSASKLNMSERLFDYYKATIKNTNKLIKDLNVIVDKNDPSKLTMVLSPDLNSNKRQKIGGYESTPVDGQNSWNVDWDGITVYLNHETTKEIINALLRGTAVATIASIVCGATGVGAPAVVETGIVAACTGAGAGILSNMNEGDGVVITYGLFGTDIETR